MLFGAVHYGQPSSPWSHPKDIVPYVEICSDATLQT